MAEGFADQIEAKILPSFRSLDSFDNMIEDVSNDGTLFPGSKKAWVTIATVTLGDIHTAQKIWRSADTETRKWRVPWMHDDHQDLDEWSRLEAPLIAGDRATLNELLHKWEKFQVKDINIERYWKSTLFPIELSS